MSSLALEKKVALVTGITGQDGSYLAEVLLEKGYEVHGLKRRSSSFNTGRLEEIYRDEHFEANNLFMHYGDLTDSLSLFKLINEIKPSEIYNLGAMSHVHVSFSTPEYVADVDAVGTLRILEAVRCCDLQEVTKIYQASTSELYGLIQETPQTEHTPFYPRSPYAVAKLYGYWICRNYREAYNMHVSNGILFNHESPRRGETFVTRKITRAVARMVNGLQRLVYLGNLDAKRDWGHAKDYVEAQWLILQQDAPSDWVIATGETYSVREFVTRAFEYCGVIVEYQNSGLDEVAVVLDAGDNQYIKKGQIVVKVDSKYFRPTEVELLIGDPTKAKQELGWQPKFTFEALISDMMENDIIEVQKIKLLSENGFDTPNLNNELF